MEEREETPDRQIKLAKRNNILIIRTEELLKVPKDKSTSYLSQGQKAYKVYKYVSHQKKYNIIYM